MMDLRKHVLYLIDSRKQRKKIVALIRCRECNVEVSSGASECPKCGVEHPSSMTHKFYIALGFVAIFFILINLPW